MAQDRTFKDNKDLQGLQGDAIIDLWTLDFQPVNPNATPADRYLRFCNWLVTDGVEVDYDSLTYFPIPYKATGFTVQTSGVPPSPSLQISNIGLAFTGFVNNWEDLVGAKLTRRRVLARHLDGGSDPDTSAHWPDETWFVQQKASENKLFVSFSLSTAFDLDGVTLPRRRALRHTCPFVYRGEGCDYAGPPIADANDNLLNLSDDADVQALLTAKNAAAAAYKTMEAEQANYLTAKNTTELAKVDVDEAQFVLDSYDGFFAFQEERYDKDDDYWATDNVPNGENYRAKWDGVPVSMDAPPPGFPSFPSFGPAGQLIYRKGEFKEATDNDFAYHSIQQWKRFIDDSQLQADLTAAQQAYNTAQVAEAAAKTTYDAAVADYNTKKAAYDTALAAWIAGGGTADLGDVCGKRLSSCKLRFFDPITQTYSALNYGGFPGLTL